MTGYRVRRSSSIVPLTRVLDVPAWRATSKHWRSTPELLLLFGAAVSERLVEVRKILAKGERDVSNSSNTRHKASLRRPLGLRPGAQTRRRGLARGALLIE